MEISARHGIREGVVTADAARETFAEAARDCCPTVIARRGGLTSPSP